MVRRATAGDIGTAFMPVGVPKEIKDSEYRVELIPSAGCE